MKKNILKTVTCGALIVAATGCLEKKSVEVTPIKASPRDALVKALEIQATGLVSSFNKVIVDSQFLKNLALENPPEPISMENEEEVKKAINYLLANEQSSNGTTVYTPDARICSEVLAKNDPATCQDVFSRITLAQSEQDASSGLVQVYLENIKAFGFVYTPEIVSLSVELPSLLDAAKRIQEIEIAHNETPEELPSSAQGSVSFSVAQNMGATIIDLTVNQKIHLQGVNSEGNSYDIAIEAGQNVVTLSAYPAMGIAALSAKLPKAELLLPVHDHNENIHAVSVSFPGASGIATLNNAMSMIDFSAIKLGAATVQAKADGQPMAQLTVNGQVDAQLTSYAGGHFGISFLSAIDGQLAAYSNPLFSEQGTVTAQIAQGTEAYFAKDADQAKLISGSFSWIGTQDFMSNLKATAGMCFQGNDQPFYLEAAVCK